MNEADKTATIQVRTSSALKEKLRLQSEAKGTKLTRWMWIAMAEKAEREGNTELKDDILAQM